MFIINQLIQHDKLSINELAAMMNKTPRSIYNYILNANRELSENGAQIVSDFSNEHSLFVFDDAKFDRFMKEATSYIDYNDEKQRIRYYLEKFLFSPDYIKVDTIINEINISRSLGKSDLKEVRRILEEYGLSLVSKPHYGLLIEGDELGRRICYKRYVLNDSDFDSLSKDETKTAISNAILYAVKDTDYEIRDPSFKNLIMHIYVAYKRVAQGEDIRVDSQVLEKQKKYPEYAIAQKIVDTLSNLFGIDIPESEIAYVCIHLRSKQNIDASKTGFISVKGERYTNQMISYLSHNSDYDFDSDFELYVSLYQHIVPLLERITYKMFAVNPLLSRIKETMPLAYSFAVGACEVINIGEGIQLNEDEISFFALYIQISIDKRARYQKKNILIICAAGRGTSMMLKQKFQNVYGESLENIYVASMMNYQQYLDKDIDVIFTTINLEIPECSIPIIKINELISDYEIAQNRLELFSQQTNNDDFDQLIKKELVYVSDATSEEEIIREMIEKASQFHQLPDNMYELIMKREEISPTVFNSVVAIPHAIVPVTEENFIVVAVPREPINWQSAKVKAVLMVFHSKKNSEHLVNYNFILSQILRSQKMLNEFIKDPTYEKLKSIVEVHEG